MKHALTPYTSSRSGSDDVDLVEVGRTLRRGWRSVLGFTLLGIAAAVAVVLFAPKRYDGSATLVLKTTDPGGSILARVGLSGGGASGNSQVPDVGGLGGLLGGNTKSPLETELQILQSRAVAHEVIDSLLLQARVRRPEGIPTAAVVRALRLPGAFKKARYDVMRSTNGSYLFSAAGVRVEGRPGTSVRLPQGEVVLRSDTALPAAFQLELLDREDITKLFDKQLVVSKAGGEVAKIEYRAADPVTAADVPDAVIGVYLARRKTVDRGVNQHRAEFLAAQSDSVARELSAAEHALRLQQEKTGLIDPVIVGKVQVEQAALLRQSLGEIDVEQGAVNRLLNGVRSGGMSARQLAAMPAFLKSSGIGELLKKLTELEVQRSALLERRTKEDPEVIALDGAARDVESQLVPLAGAYDAALRQQRRDVASQLDTIRAALGVFPAALQSGNRLQRDVIRLGSIYAAIQAQLVEARLAAIGEGGDVRQLDAAEPSKKPAFPRPLFTLALGTVGGLACGFLSAFLIGVMGRWANDPREIERHVGVPALRFAPGQPLMLSGAAGSRTILLVPLVGRADTQAVADRLAQTASARGASVTVLDLASTETSPPNVPQTLRRLEETNDLTIVRLPGLESDAAAAALAEARPVLFVAPEGRVDRVHLSRMVESLRRLDVPCAGVVLSDPIERPAATLLRTRLSPVS